jgi:hypothetical protein
MRVQLPGDLCETHLCGRLSCSRGAVPVSPLLSHRGSVNAVPIYLNTLQTKTTTMKSCVTAARTCHSPENRLSRKHCCRHVGSLPLVRRHIGLTVPYNFYAGIFQSSMRVTAVNVRACL